MGGGEGEVESGRWGEEAGTRMEYEVNDLEGEVEEGSSFERARGAWGSDRTRTRRATPLGRSRRRG